MPMHRMPEGLPTHATPVVAHGSRGWGGVRWTPFLRLADARAWREAGALVVVALLITAALLIAGMAPQDPVSAPAAGNRDGISLAEVGAHADLLWIDARPAAEYAQGHIPGAVSCPMDAEEPDLAPVLEHWRPELLVVVYCSSDSCDASQELASRLRQDLGSQRVRYLLGGWDAWRKRPPP
jgi:rhodanese-related sulfurtransferase